MEEERTPGANHKDNYLRAINRLKDGTDKFLIPKNRDLTLQFLQDAEVGKTIPEGQKKKIKEGRLVRVYGLLRKMDSDWLKKAFDEFFKIMWDAIKD